LNDNFEVSVEKTGGPVPCRGHLPGTHGRLWPTARHFPWLDLSRPAGQTLSTVANTTNCGRQAGVGIACNPRGPKWASTNAREEPSPLAATVCLTLLGPGPGPAVVEGADCWEPTGRATYSKPP
jgi:hypothetical protein